MCCDIGSSTFFLSSNTSCLGAVWKVDGVCPVESVKRLEVIPEGMIVMMGRKWVKQAQGQADAEKDKLGQGSVNWPFLSFKKHFQGAI